VNDDIETIRRGLKPWAPPDNFEAVVALDRLERYLQDSDAELEAEREARPKLEAEVERLRGELLEVHDKLAHADNEIERLLDAAYEWTQERERLEAEIERLRDTTVMGHLLRRAERAEAEVERLQDRLNSLRESHFAQPHPLRAEVERLQAALEKITKHQGLAGKIARDALAKEVTPIQTDP
jgi:chromosome segregation ATPase